MEFWGVEVKSGETFEVNLDDGKVLHLSQASLGEVKNNKSESICLNINVKGKKLVLGTLHSERLPQQLFDLVFDKTFTVSHNWKHGSVSFFGYMADQPGEMTDDDDLYEDSDEEEEAIRLPTINGKQEAKKEVKEDKKEVKEDKKEEKVAANKKDGKQVKIVEPAKDKKADDDDSDSDSSDDSDAMSDDSDSDEEMKDSSDDSDDSSDEEEETPKKQHPSGKKRPNESAIKTPTTDKKAKTSTPQKTDGKKAAAHVATPHPSKQAVSKTESKSNQKSPASAADGAHSCKACNRNFKTDGALESHNKAKHTSK